MTKDTIIGFVLGVVVIHLSQGIYRHRKELWRILRGHPRIPGGWSIGDSCHFSHPGKQGLLGSRVIGRIVAYDPQTNIISLEYEGKIFKQQHTREWGGISGA